MSTHMYTLWVARVIACSLYSVSKFNKMRTISHVEDFPKMNEMCHTREYNGVKIVYSHVVAYDVGIAAFVLRNKHQHFADLIHGLVTCTRKRITSHRRLGLLTIQLTRHVKGKHVAGSIYFKETLPMSLVRANSTARIPPICTHSGT